MAEKGVQTVPNFQTTTMIVKPIHQQKVLGHVVQQGALQRSNQVDLKKRQTKPIRLGKSVCFLVENVPLVLML
ncbi:MAG: hypothetical protein MJE68_17285 [Proteobacteria bacterium]|nr:hypothetical protein [Pseudomonadota bacterium]